MVEKPIVYVSEKEKEFCTNISEALLKYCRDGIGTIYIDDIRIELLPSKDKWHKMSLYFKVVE